MKQGLICLILFLMNANLSAQNWPGWRGPNRDGVLHHNALPEVLPDSLKLNWRVQIGEGYSSPIVVDGTAYVYTRVGEEEVLSSISLKDGKIIWQQKNDAPFTKNQYALKQGKGPFSTPTFDDGKIYALGVNGLLSCFKADSGNLLWRRSFKERVDTSNMFCGTSMAPLLEAGKCIVHVGDDFTGALIAYSAGTGKILWDWKDHGPSYASPILVELNGTKQIVTLTDKACIGADFQTGKILWQIPFIDEWNENIVTPVVSQNMIILSGVRKGTFAIEVTKGKDGWVTNEVWKNNELPMYMSSPVLHGKFLFGFSNKMKGQLFCLNAMTGETLWTSEGRMGQNATLMVTNDKLLVLTTSGELLIVKLNNEKFDPIKSYQVAQTTTWAQPVFLPEQLLVKDSESLALYSF